MVEGDTVCDPRFGDRARGFAYKGALLMRVLCDPFDLRFTRIFHNINYDSELYGAILYAAYLSTIYLAHNISLKDVARFLYGINPRGLFGLYLEDRSGRVPAFHLKRWGVILVRRLVVFPG